METFKKSLVAYLIVMFLVICNVSLASTEKKTKNQKRTYIVHVAKSEMPRNFDHHSLWYKSLLNSVSNSAEMLYTYDKAIHGFSARLTAEEARLLKSQAQILKVVREKIYKLHTTRTPHFLGLDKIAEMIPESNEGRDVIIGLLDTGIWPESKSFDDTGLGPIPSNWKGKCEAGTNFTASNCNKKLIGARFFNKDFEATMGPTNELKLYESPRDDKGHGSHTASTAAGSAVQGASLFGYASGTARGMASRARVAVYKVCWGGLGCSSSDILAGMDTAISDNVNVLSLSLGSRVDSYDEDSIAVGAFAAMESGIFVSCSAGNDGPILSSLGANVAPWVITVGAGTLDREFPAYISLGNGQNYSGVSIFSGGNSLPDTRVPFIYSDCSSMDSLVAKKVKGKIVLCDGDGSNAIEKGFVVKSAGGLGMVLADTDGGNILLAEGPHLLPTSVVGVKAGTAIKKYLSSDPKPMATIVSQGTKVGIKPSPVVAHFSSRGPNPITPEILKPDLIAPGVNILAAWPRLESPSSFEQDDRHVDFNIISGTSMACPHVSGIAALVKSVYPNWSPAAIRSALMTTAYSTYNNGQKLLADFRNKSATPFDIGAGHVNPVAALHPGLVYDLTVNDYLNFLCALNYTPEKFEVVTRRKYSCDAQKHYNIADLNYPSFAVVFKRVAGGKGAVVVKHTRTLANMGEAGTYKVSVTLDIASVKITVEPDMLSFNKNEKKSYAVTFVASVPLPSGHFGFGRLEWSNGKNVVGSPISISWT